MATESPIRIPRGPNKWATLKPLNMYRPSSAEMAIEGLGLFLKEQKLQSHENDVVPTRSESAPPSMEGSMAAIENMLSHKVTISNRDDPSLSFHGSSDANSDKKFKRPIHGAKYVDGSRTSLHAHKEESEDDQLSEHSMSASAEKAASWGYHSNSLDSSQVMSLDGSKDSFVEPTAHERALSTAKVSVKEYINVDSTVSGEALGVSHSGTHIYQNSEPLSPSNNMLQAHIVPQDASSHRVEGSYSGTAHPYGTLTHPFHYGPSSASGQEVQPVLQSSGLKPPFFTTTAAYMTPSSQYYPSMQQAGYFHPQYNTPYNLNSAVFPSYMGGYSQQGGVPMAFNGASFPVPGVDASSIHAYDPQNLMKFYGQFGMQMQPHFSMQCLQPSSLHGMYGHHNQTPIDGSYMTQVSPREPRQGGELAGLGIEHRPQNLSAVGYNSLNLARGTTSGHYPFAGPGYVDPSMQFRAPSIVSPLKQAKAETGTNYSGARYYGGPSHSSSASPSRSSEFQSPSWSNMNSYSLLEELKSGKGQRYRLSDVAGHICEFSIDQHGSRFIQQQLETCSDEEKASVLDEVVLHASKLMTDVFGNYVIQKLFEYGSPKQRENLANLLQGQILPLSLQMYGCRVIQKALDVIELEQKTKLVRELDGHVIRCVRDQNGNHVIQKCIEGIPSEKIEFIISSFRGQVATLSMHPYGCRVIQRVLEHCDDGLNTQFIIGEILESVCSLAQDQYGNYVTQHVLERGKQHERSLIIKKLTESVVQLSQHKFASNVVEKCLEYSDSAARDLLIKEIIGDGEKNDNLLMMMKDQYANYVIQKILQKCSDDQREVLLGLVRNHLTSLKKYTYGKHIVARFEMICGEETEETGQ